MHLIHWLPPIVGALTTALIVVCASSAAEALGPLWGALIASLRVSAGPAYVFLAMQHDDGFAAASALGSLVAKASARLFLIIYVRDRLRPCRRRRREGFGRRQHRPGAEAACRRDAPDWISAQPIGLVPE